MMYFVVFLVGLALGITLVCAGFIYLNAKRPDALDKGEDALRKL